VADDVTIYRTCFADLPCIQFFVDGLDEKQSTVSAPAGVAVANVASTPAPRRSRNDVDERLGGGDRRQASAVGYPKVSLDFHVVPPAGESLASMLSRAAAPSFLSEIAQSIALSTGLTISVTLSIAPLAFVYVPPTTPPPFPPPPPTEFGEVQGSQPDTGSNQQSSFLPKKDESVSGINAVVIGVIGGITILFCIGGTIGLFYLQKRWRQHMLDKEAEQKLLNEASHHGDGIGKGGMGHGMGPPSKTRQLTSADFEKQVGFCCFLTHAAPPFMQFESLLDHIWRRSLPCIYACLHIWMKIQKITYYILRRLGRARDSFQE
jgi:hypothetical protein